MTLVNLASTVSFAMRDYRSITADAFLVEGINSKLKWLTRRLWYIDEASEIGNGVAVLELVRHRVDYF